MSGNHPFVMSQRALIRLPGKRTGPPSATDLFLAASAHVKDPTMCQYFQEAMLS